MTGFYTDKIVLVTGGNSGIGRELVRQLSADGAVVTAWGRDETTGDSLVREITGKGGRLAFHVVEITDPEQVEAGINLIMQEHSRIDYVFHCAAIIMGGEIRDHAIEDIRKLLNINVVGTSHVSFFAYRVMAQQGFGHLVNISSGAGIFPVPLMGMYSASKFAVLGMSEVLRLEGHGLGVKVSAVAPGLVDTPIYDRAIYSRTKKAKTLSALKKRLYMIQPDQAARTILKGTRRNRAVIHTQMYVRVSWMAYRYVPHLYRLVVRQFMIPFRKKIRRPED